MKENILKDKSYSFSVRIVKLSQFLVTEKKEYVLSKQILRSGTSVGANIREAEYAQSKADFIHKLSISLKEANETEYWLDLLFDTNYLNNDLYKSLIIDIQELLKLLIFIIKKTKSNLKNNKYK